MARVWVQTTDDTIELTDCALGKLIDVSAWHRTDGSPTTYVAWYVGPRISSVGLGKPHGKSSAPRIPDGNTEFKSLDEAKAFALSFLADRKV
jgi:hypothetical protein